MKKGYRYDFIGDVHGRFDKLEPLLIRLGYSKDGPSYVPPPGTRAVFLGDLIDTKPGHENPGGIRATLEAVKAMHDRGHALCLMGNHELNAICFHSMDSDDRPLRNHGAKNLEMHRGTLNDFPDYAAVDGEWKTIWMPWLKRLPIYLDLGGVRAVHACWHAAHLDFLRDKSLQCDTFLHATSDPINPEGVAIECVLKGIELPLPPGSYFEDHQGIRRSNFRARWWEAPTEGMLCRNLVFPESVEIPATPLPRSSAAMLQPYPEEAPPLFIGHYFKRADSALEPERPNLACLDFSAAKDGPLVAYRWSGEARLDPSHYVTHLS
jgi:hypothetical protein